MQYPHQPKGLNHHVQNGLEFPKQTPILMTYMQILHYNNGFVLCNICKWVSMEMTQIWFVMLIKDIVPKCNTCIPSDCALKGQ
jgi:hypothetical protein